MSKNTSTASMRRDILVRTLRGVPDAHYAVLRYDPRQGETFWDAVREARREVAERSDLLQAAIRRADRPGHPWICQWKRKSAKERWAFEWMRGRDAAALR